MNPEERKEYEKLKQVWNLIGIYNTDDVIKKLRELENKCEEEVNIKLFDFIIELICQHCRVIKEKLLNMKVRQPKYATARAFTFLLMRSHMNYNDKQIGWKFGTVRQSVNRVITNHRKLNGKTQITADKRKFNKDYRVLTQQVENYKQSLEPNRINSNVNTNLA